MVKQRQEQRSLRFTDQFHAVSAASILPTLSSWYQVCSQTTSDNSIRMAQLQLTARITFRSWISKHLLYLQIRRCILEQQLVCPYPELINLTGLALQAEFGNYNVNVSQREIHTIHANGMKLLSRKIRNDETFKNDR